MLRSVLSDPVAQHNVMVIIYCCSNQESKQCTDYGQMTGCTCCSHGPDEECSIPISKLAQTKAIASEMMLAVHWQGSEGVSQRRPHSIQRL